MTITKILPFTLMMAVTALTIKFTLHPKTRRLKVLMSPMSSDFMLKGSP